MCDGCNQFPTGCLSPLCLSGKENIMTILQEIQIRIDKLSKFEHQSQEKTGLAATLNLRRNEYESLKSWIEVKFKEKL